MRVEQFRWSEEGGWQPEFPGRLGNAAQLVLLFGDRSLLKQRRGFDELAGAYPNARLLGCSTAGEILGARVSDDSLVATAIALEEAHAASGCVRLSDVSNSFEAGELLAKSLSPDGLVHVLVLSDGIGVNGSDLVRGLTSRLPSQVTATGGLSGDGPKFQETLVVYDGIPERDSVAVLGFYGEGLSVGYASLGGWDPFGPDRLITKSKGNVLYELDGRSALELYKQYLGEHAEGLPATGLLFPLSVRSTNDGTGLVRTILSVNEEEQSMTFAGDVPEGSYARLMRANFDHLIDGALGAARTSFEATGSNSPDLAVLISCVGRKLVLKQRVEEEVEAVRNVLGPNAALTGFYSYGEISPFAPGANCELHNQTMTITTFREC
jgi:hypothetical protein